MIPDAIIKLLVSEGLWAFMRCVNSQCLIAECCFESARDLRFLDRKDYI